MTDEVKTATIASPRRLVTALIAGAAIGTLGGLIGLGGAEFRLPLLITIFAFVALEAVIVNKAISLIVVASAFVFRSKVVLRSNHTFVLTMAAGSIVGTYIGSRLLVAVPAALLLPILAIILVVSAIKVWRHE